MKRTTVKGPFRAALLGMLLAASLLLGYIEHILPPVTSVPGIKLGLANIPVVYALYALDRRGALLLAAAKTLLSCMLFGGFSAFIYSFLGMAASIAVMLTLAGRGDTSPVGVSAAGGAAHTAAQLAAAIMLTGTAALWRLIAPLIALGTISGTVCGITARILLERLPDALKITSDEK